MQVGMTIEVEPRTVSAILYTTFQFDTALNEERD